MTIVVIGCSAGGTEALAKICNNLPSDFKGAVVIVWHLAEESEGLLPEIIKKKSKLPVSNAKNQEKISAGHIYIAPPNRHLLIEGSKLRVVYGPKENRFRPAIDPLFRSAAFYHNANVIGVILSGMLNDGTAGLWAVKDRGGITIVQDPDDALYGEMPNNALSNVKTDFIIPAENIADILVSESSKLKPSTKKAKKSKQLEIEINLAMDKSIPPEEIKKLGKVSEFTCPECHGSLWEMAYGNILRFRCRTGHAYTAQSLAAHQSETVEMQLWMAIRGLEESVSMLNYYAGHLKKGKEKSSENHLISIRKIEKASKKLRNILMEEKLA